MPDPAESLPNRFNCKILARLSFAEQTVPFGHTSHCETLKFLVSQQQRVLRIRVEAYLDDDRWHLGVIVFAFANKRQWLQRNGVAAELVFRMDELTHAAKDIDRQPTIWAPLVDDRPSPPRLCRYVCVGMHVQERIGTKEVGIEGSASKIFVSLAIGYLRTCEGVPNLRVVRKFLLEQISDAEARKPAITGVISSSRMPFVVSR